jgi:hypothetical protein
VLTSILNNQIYNRSAEYEILEDLALAEAQKNRGVKVLTIEPESQKKMTVIAQKLWEKIAAKSPENKVAVDMVKKFLKDLGHM